MWINSKYLDMPVDKMAKFVNYPFPHVVLNDFFSNKIEMVAKDLLKHKFHFQNTDLFQFWQTDKFKGAVKEFNSFFTTEFVDFISRYSGMKLTKADMSGFVYRDTDYLLPHDDRLQGRKIAYIVNLSSLDVSDGGALQLFSNGKVVKSIYPKFNSLVMFKVSPKSIHRVEEVKSSKNRLTLTGWFHG